MDKFIVNIIHRPEMVPEYSATVTGQGKKRILEIRSSSQSHSTSSRHSRDLHMRRDSKLQSR